MGLTGKVYLSVIAGVGGAVGLYWFLTRRKRACGKAPPGIMADKTEGDNIISWPESAVFHDILKLLSKVTLEPHPDATTLRQLSSMLSSLTESELNEIKLSSDYVSFMISEWVFYHTLRTNKSVTWNSSTGLIDQALSPQERELGGRIATTIRKAYWDKHLEDLSKDPPNYTHVVDRLEELQARINEYQKSKRSVIFDIELVKQLISHSKFDREFFMSLVQCTVNAMHDLESPAAHEETLKYFQQIQNVCVTDNRAAFHSEIISSLRFLFSQLDLLEAELANFKSSQLAAESKRKKERELFHGLLSEQLVSGEKLRTMLSVIPPESRENYGALTSAIIIRFKQIVLLATSESTCLIPESMNPDMRSLESFRDRRNKISLVASFLVGFHSQLASVIGESAIVFLRQDVEVMNALVRSIFLAQSQQEMLDILCDSLESFMARPLSTKQREQLEEAVEKCCAKSCHLRILLDRRVASLIEKGLTDSSNTVSSTALGSRPWFLSVCAKETSLLLSDMIDFTAEHLQVYLPVYRDIVTNAL